MAHIPDGVLSVPVVAAGIAISVPLVALSLKQLNDQKVPRTAVLASAFFVASMVTFPVGPTSVHLLLGGVIGVLLGMLAIPAILSALILQFFLFGYGGLLVMGVNLWILAIPALAAHGLFRHLPAPVSIWWKGLFAGIAATLLTAFFLLGNLVVSDPGYATSASIIALTYVPLALVEGLVTAVCLSFLARVAPNLLSNEVS